MIETLRSGQTLLAGIVVLGGLFFLAVSSLGLIRLPDVYTRNHAVGKSETLGSMLMLTGLAIYNGLDLNSLKLLIIVVFVMLANPTATHIVMRAALRSGVQPWVKKDLRHVELAAQAEQNSVEGLERRGNDE